jgi:hypothetical protein
MNNIEKVKELIAAKLSKDIKYYRQIDEGALAHGYARQDGSFARNVARSREKALEMQIFYDNRDSIIIWAEEILGQFNFTLHGISEDGLSYTRKGGEHTREMAVHLDYGAASSMRHSWQQKREIRAGMAESYPSFRADTDKKRRYYKIGKNNFAKQIEKRIEERESIEDLRASRKSLAYEQQAEVKKAFAKVKAGVNSVWPDADDPTTSLKSEIVNWPDARQFKHVFSMDFAGRDVPLSYVNYHSAEFEKGSLLVKVDFSAGGSESRIEKTMLLQEFLESELIYRIYFDDALA